jgi:hypothetical protein
MTVEETEQVSSLPRVRMVMIWVMAAFYLVAGIVHLAE